MLILQQKRKRRGQTSIEASRSQSPTCAFNEGKVVRWRFRVHGSEIYNWIEYDRNDVMVPKQATIATATTATTAIIVVTWVRPCRWKA